MEYIRDGKEEFYLIYDGEMIKKKEISKLDIGLQLFEENLIKGTNINDIFKINFVGFITLKNNASKRINLISMPKEYNVTNIIDDNKLNNREIRKVLITIINTKNEQGINNKSENLFVNLIYQLNIVKTYYDNFGLYKENKSIKNKLKKGKIDWNKTIRRLVPMVQDNDIIYNEYYVGKKILQETIITDIMAYIIEKIMIKYQFFIEVPNINYTYKNKIKNIKSMIKELNYKLNKIFKDSDRELILAMIKILNIERTDINNHMSIYTREYKYVWEKMINTIFEVEKPESEKISDQGHNIELDHFNNRDKVILDSKYYVYKEKLKDDVDYKQLFYFYQFVILKQIQENKNYNQIKEENLKWINALIKPKKIEGDKFYEIDNHISRIKEKEFEDNIIIKNIYINPIYIIDMYLRKDIIKNSQLRKIVTNDK